MKMKVSRKIILSLAVTALMFAASSCGVSRTATTGSTATVSGSSSGSGKTSSRTISPAPAKPAVPLKHIDFASLQLDPVVENLLREADSWIGTPYVYGGNDRQGVDCSGFVVEVFRNSSGIKLPRTSLQQQEFCATVDRESMEPGDLVFFTVRGGDVVGHVGIYIGNDCMVHASSSKGVIISSLNANYYVVNYFGSGRVEPFYALTGKKKAPVAVPAPTSPVVAPTANLAIVPKPAPTEAATKEDVASIAAQRVKRIGNIEDTPADAQSRPSVTTGTGNADAGSDLEDFFD
ncbi:MAG: NlpC/P60 family protein [Bacteroides sp.]|nr:NlpC/P60 family protein [Bacteroides sp.]MCM1412906.1 NlpC/P60 family protein [Bacteroides sp.]MCM1471575.1 NlpC/P60 family protein [Bacteroides sp.]